MKSYLFILIVLSAFLISCSTKNNDIIKHEIKEKKGTLRINENSYFVSLFPPSTKDIVSLNIVAQCYDGLVKYNTKTLEVIPAIAKSWDIDPLGVIYTFHLNKNVFFHDNDCFPNGKGRLVTAFDIKYTFEYLSTKSSDNHNFFGTVDKIKGAKKYYEASSKGKPSFGIDGIKIIDDATLQITLEAKNPLFLNYIATPTASILAKEAIEKYGNKCYVGTGAFMITSLPELNKPFFLICNPNYYRKSEDGKSLPYLDTVKITFEEATIKELEMFENGTLDVIVGLSNDYMPKFLEKHIKDFEANPPKYILNHSEETSTTELFNLLRSNVNNFHTNRMNYIDLSIVYLKEAKAKEEKQK